MAQHLTWPSIMAVLRGSFRSLLYGPPGTGKTRAAYETAKSLRKELFNITLSDETPAAELRGHYVPQGTKWAWNHGPAVRAAIKTGNGGLLLLDEIDKASQDCLDFLHGLLNDPEVSQITLPNGEVLRPKAGFQVIATMNGDITDLQPSLQDRFSVAIEIDTPHPDAIAALPEDLQGVAQNMETYEGQNAALRPATIRRWAAFATLRDIEGISVEDAAKAVFAHRAPELMDAIGFKATLTDVPGGELVNTDEEPEEEEEDSPCTCDECTMDRLQAWMRHNGLELTHDDDGDPLCPKCGAYHEVGSYDTEEEAAHAAMHCCYDDDEWVAYARAEGISAD